MVNFGGVRLTSCLENEAIDLTPGLTPGEGGRVLCVCQNFFAKNWDFERGVVTTTLAADGSAFDWSALLDGLFTVHSAGKPPSNAAVVAQHRGRWF